MSPLFPLVPRVRTLDESNPKDLVGATKPQLDLVPPALTLYVAKVMILGAKKYGAFNWRKKKVRHSIYLAAAMRHILQALDGEAVDPESGQSHEAHAAACLGIVLDARANDSIINDLPTKGPAAKIIRELTDTTPAGSV